MRPIVAPAAVAVVMVASAVGIGVAGLITAASLVFVDSPVFSACVVFGAHIFFAVAAGCAVIVLYIRAAMVAAVAGNRCDWSG